MPKVWQELLVLESFFFFFFFLGVIFPFKS